MVIKIKACSFDEAYDEFKEDYSEYKDLPLIKLPNNDLDNDSYESLGLVFYKMIKFPGENINKTQTLVNDFPSQGTKKWESKYIIVDCFDNLLTNKSYKFKKEAVDSARIITNELYQSSFVLLGKSLIEASRLQAEIKYKPAQSQDDGEWLFIN